MAETNPKPLPNDGDDPPHNTNTTSAAGGSHQSKHPKKNPGSNSNEVKFDEVTGTGSPKKEPEVKIEETVTSDPKPKKGDVDEVNIYNIDIMHEILEYKNLKGVDPADNPDDLREFCTPFIHLDIGNARGWIRKMRELKNKFNDDSAPVEDLDKQEFKLWKKIWGNEGKGDGDPGVGSSE
ncbi:hypothetical protein LXL04_016395 [Taraxacum kok-saghyz]